MKIQLAREMDLMRRAAIRIGLVVLTLSAVALVASPGPSLQASEPEGLQFKVQCKQTGGSLDGVGSVTCALVVTGLPEPLENKVSVTLFTADNSNDTPSDPAPTDTVVASEAPAITPGAPVLVSRHLPLVPPLPPPVSAQVPEPPPKRL